MEAGHESRASLPSISYSTWDNYDLLSLGWPQVREDNDIPYVLAAGRQHGKSVHANPKATRRWHTVLEGLQEVLINRVGFVIAGRSLPSLRLETLPLFYRVGQLGEGVGYLLSRNEDLEALGEPGGIELPASQWRYFLRVVHYERRLNQIRLNQFFVQFSYYPAWAGTVLDFYFITEGQRSQE